MNTFKPGCHTTAYRPMNINGRLLMSASIYIGFSLIDGKPLGEQDLWLKIAPLLAATPLDDGFPKARGEFFASGCCHTPGGKALQRAEVIVQVGNIEKHLAVFGERVWRRGGFGMTEPQEFTSIPLTWNHSFGHEHSAFNQLGQGIIPDKSPSDAVIRLPNVEYFDDLIVDTHDRPKPAAMLPIPPHWEPRASQSGTYDQEWKKHRWPWHPVDIDWSFFNAAPEDQQLSGFFEGGESVRIKGMHPDFQDIRTTVPVLRPRCFATVKKAPGANAEHDAFREIQLKADTLWLFPEVMSGILIYHGTTPVQDEEFDDVRHFFSVMENPSEPPAPLEEYLDQQWIKAVEVSPYFFGKELTYKETKAVSQFLWLQQANAKLEKNSKRVLEEAPEMPFSSAMTRSIATRPFSSMRRQSGQTLKDLDAIPPGEEANRWRRRIISQRDKLYIKERQSVKRLDSMLSAQHEKMLHMARLYPQRIPEGTLDEMLGALQNQTSINPWHDRGFSLAVQCRQRLELDDAASAALEQLSFHFANTEITWFGYLDSPFRQNPEEWGLPPNGGSTIPAGLVLPRFDGKTLTRLSILEGWQLGMSAKEVASLKPFLVPGSDPSPLLFDSPTPGAPVVIVPGELEAWLVDEALSGTFTVLALPHSSSGPDAEAVANLSEQAKNLLAETETLVVLLPKGPKPTKKDADAWLPLHVNPIFVRLPESDTVLDASSFASVALDRLIQAHLPPESLGVSIEELVRQDVDPMQEAEKKFKASMNKMALAQVDKMEASFLAHLPPGVNIQAHMETARRKILHPEEFKHERLSSNPKMHLRLQKNKLIEQQNKFQKIGFMTPDLEKELQAAFDNLDKMNASLDEGNASLKEEMAISTSGRKPHENEIPDAFTREVVLDFARKGISLEGQDISKLDLSGLDLSGVCMAFASMDETDFSGSDLTGAILAGIQAESVNFSSTNLRGATLQLCSLVKCNLAGAVLDDAKFNQTFFSKCDCSGASLRNADVYMTSFSDCEFAETIFDEASFSLASLSGKAPKASFQGSSHMQTGFMSMTLDNANFARADAGGIRMFDCTGEGLVFYEANMEGAMLHQCVFPKVDFRRAKMIQAAIYQTELPHADFTGSILIGSRIDKSELKNAQLYGVNAADCVFFKSDMEGADMRGSNFMSASFAGSRLVSCNMRLANCFGTDFRRAVFGETLLEGTTLRNTLLEERVDLL